MRRVYLPILLVLWAFLSGCDETQSAPDPSEGGANPSYAGRFVGTWGEEEPDANFILTLFIAPEQGHMVGTGSVTRRLVTGQGFEETAYPLQLSGHVAEGMDEPEVEINAQLPTGQLLVVRGVGRDGTVIDARLSGATPFGLHIVDEVAFRRSES